MNQKNHKVVGSGTLVVNERPSMIWTAALALSGSRSECGVRISVGTISIDRTSYQMDKTSTLTPDEVEESLRLEALCLKGHTTAVSADGHLYEFLDSQPRVELSSGFSMPLIGLGTW